MQVTVFTEAFASFGVRQVQLASSPHKLGQDGDLEEVEAIGTVVEHCIPSPHMFSSPLDDFSLLVPLLDLHPANEMCIRVVFMVLIPAGGHEDLIPGVVVQELFVKVEVAKDVLF
jgi:hypothetical protein